MYVYDVYDPKEPPIYTKEQQMVDLAMKNSKDTYAKEKERQQQNDKKKSNEEVKQNE